MVPLASSFLLQPTVITSVSCLFDLNYVNLVVEFISLYICITNKLDGKLSAVSTSTFFIGGNSITDTKGSNRNFSLTTSKISVFSPVT